MQIIRDPDPDTVRRAIAAHPHGAEGRWVLDTETDGLRVRGPNAPHTAHYIGLAPVGAGRLCFTFSRRAFEPVRDDVERLHLVGHNLRFDVHALNLDIAEWEDTMLFQFFNSTTSRKSLDALARIRGWDKVPTPPELKGARGERNEIHRVPRADLDRYLADDCLFTAYLYERIQKRDGVRADQRFETAVRAMEHRGVRVYQDRLRAFEEAARATAAEKSNILRSLGFSGDPASSVQVGEWLAGARGLRLPRTATGRPSTNKKALKRLYENGDEGVRALLDWRSATKLVQGFVSGIWGALDREDMLYPSVHTCASDEGGTRTGRVSYSDPPLQQAPKHHPTLGPMARRCFTARGGRVCGADFAQLELRVAAALSGEPWLLEAFESDDPHTLVARRAFGDPVTPVKRQRSKAISFGILNGMGAKGLAVELSCSRDEARRWKGRFLEALPRLALWMEATWREAEVSGVAQTVAGRARLFESHESTRPAMSVIVQGSAAEVKRAALVALERAGAAPIIDMHDEFVCEAPLLSGAEVGTIMEQAANAAFPAQLGSVRFAAEGGQGDSWSDV